ncbi:thioredoxin domain-containing protein [Novispirillum sp. DQ9]|uniref:thioredoxin domain-containing protein n=1 Tax=Novispirillum sp. DQ9 TaxID=3398612 RepID=UPI003C7BE5C9
MANRLAEETSPYLLQHAGNPVAWQPWGEAALAQARAENKPILLSVGYAACHWCHVMAHESFENDDIAALMNAHFVNIKVDREERPDVDALYQKALAMMGEHGGWPLTMFLTPDGAPFWGGTYFPPEDRWGRPGFPRVLAELNKVWREAPDKVTNNAGILRDALVNPRTEGDAADHVQLSLPILDRAAAQILDHVDTTWGGLRGAPKFPMPFVFDTLWRAWRRTRDARFRDAVTVTLDNLCQGGIYDHLGGGFARYSTDEFWLAPHFEKMLYDNAQMIDLLALVWRETRSPLYATRVAETIGWLEREMLTEGDAFAATLDADSEGEEGRFYVWTAAEIDSLLGADGALFKQVYDVTSRGNWEGKTILRRNAGRAAVEVDEEDLGRQRAVLLAARDKRVRPGRDDKVLADWNGLMIAALANAGQVFGRPEWIALGRRAFDRVVALLGRPDGRLGHSYRAGRRQDAAVLDDYANMARAALALYEVQGEAALLDAARGWVTVADARYWDDGAGGYFFTADDATDLLTRTKSVADAAAPSGNGTMAHVLGRLHLLTGEEAWRHRAESLIAAMAPESIRSFPSSATFLNGFELLARGVQVVIAAPPGQEAAAEALRRAALDAGEPTLTLLVLTPGVDLPEHHPAAADKRPVDGKATAYVCRGPVCSAPMTEAEALRRDLGNG